MPMVPSPELWQRNVSTHCQISAWGQNHYSLKTEIDKLANCLCNIKHPKYYPDGKVTTAPPPCLLYLPSTCQHPFLWFRAMAFLRTCLSQRTYQSVQLSVKELIKLFWSFLIDWLLAFQQFTLWDLMPSFVKWELTQNSYHLAFFFSENWFL